MKIQIFRNGCLLLEKVLYFEEWLIEDDFRIPLATHVEFLWAQLQTVDCKEQSLTEHLKQPVWGEALPTNLTAIRPAHPLGLARDRCVVTAYVGSLFQWIFGQGIEIIDTYSEPHGHEARAMGDTGSGEHVPKPGQAQTQLPYYSFYHEKYWVALHPRFTTSTTGTVRTGDVIELSDEGNLWKKSTKKRYAFVTDQSETSDGMEKLKILWLYWPEDLELCMSMRYPYSNEVCFS